MSGELNYGARIPVEAVTSAEKEILTFMNGNTQGYIGRGVLAGRQLTNPNTLRDIVRKVDMTNSEDGVSSAKIGAVGTIPEIVGTKREEVIYNIMQISDSVLVNEQVIKIDPTAWNGDIRAAMLACQMRENYSIINGEAKSNLVGIVGAARANPRGKIVNTAGSGITKDNAGNWYGTETDHMMDPYEDLVFATSKINPIFPRSSLSLLGQSTDLGQLFLKDELRNPYIDQIYKLFGRAEGDTSFMVSCDYVPLGYVYVVAKHPSCAEVVMGIDYAVDADYARVPGKNRYAEIAAMLALEFHDYSGIVEVDIR